MLSKIESSEKKIEYKSSIPKYIQTANDLADEILSGKIENGYRLPSINELSKTRSISRDTAEKAYKELRDRNLAFSVMGVGNFVSVNDEKHKNILFLINKPCSYKMEVYDSFVTAIGNNVLVDMHLYYNDEQLFIEVIKKNIHNYNYFVIMPHFRNSAESHVNYTPNVINFIEGIPKEKLVILDNSCKEITGDFIAVYQDFKSDIYNALKEGIKKFKKYKKIIFVHPEKAAFPAPASLVEGFLEFCGTYHFEYEIVAKITDGLDFKNKEAYITIEDNDLVNLMQQIKEKKLKIGKDVGVISYNETPLKALLNITVMSTDFKAMGQKAAELILNRKKEISKNPFCYIQRTSL
ncbi:winged helix-turn-helix domain-containing protein [Flavobacterium chungbukense]|uniref:GntR family transcriptional regulator n=1 Tax=Flavobacterium chungbukense TaxID=877464 RepID=A0ABP7Y7Z1_9FLAO|nr:winged helix-turn-helix domain-containing protein [Flavobacterium chungbukense]MCC4923799.1 substrate-binding domain-containing protein [Flavobacterium chungbukense]